MSTNYLFIVITIVLLLLPATADIIDRKKGKKWYKRLTVWGIVFYIVVFLGAFLQSSQEFQNSKNETVLKNQIDSLTIIGLNNLDTISKLRGTINSLISTTNIIDNKTTRIERQSYLTNEKVTILGKTNDSINKIKLDSDRPIISLFTAKLTSVGFRKNEYLAFTFVNRGKRPATNLSGKVYGINGDMVFKFASIAFDKSEIFTFNQSFVSRMNLMFNLNPDSTSVDESIYFLHKITYSDLITGTSYNTDIACKVSPFTKGNYDTILSFCTYWETAKMRKAIELFLFSLKHQNDTIYLPCPE